MKLLSIDTSSRYGSIALTDCSRVIAELTTFGVLNQSELLVGQVEALLAAVGWSLAGLDGFVVVNGPGSFTGLRVGLATVQGLAFATGKPAVGVSSLLTLALGLPYCALPVCAVLDARKGEVYAAVYRWEGEALVEVLAPAALPPDALLSSLSGPHVVMGDGAEVLLALQPRHSQVKLLTPLGSGSCLRAAVAGGYAYRSLSQGTLEPGSGLSPTYLRPPEAEVKLGAAV